MKTPPRLLHGGDPGVSDEELLGSVPTQPDRLECIYVRWAPRLASLVRNAGVPQDSVADVLQVIFMEIWRHAGRFDPVRGTAKAWIFQVARNRTVDWMRRMRPQISLEDAGPLVAEVSDPIDKVMVEASLTVLTPKERQLLELAYYGGFTQREIADLWGVPLGTIKTWSRRALDKMRKQVT